MGAKKNEPTFTCFLMFLLLGIPILSSSQEQTNTVYFGKDFFMLEGTEINDSLKENRYDRLPLSYKEVVRKPVWELSKASAGMLIF